MELQNSDLTEGFLSLSNSEAGDKEVIQLCTLHTHLLSQLFLSQNHICHLAIKRMSQVKWDNLHSLYLGLNKIGNKGCKYLSKGPFTRLKMLAINNNQIESAGMLHLSKVDWTNLATIFLSDNHLTGGTKDVSKTKLGNKYSISTASSGLTYPDMFYLLLLTPKDLELYLIYNLADSYEKDRMKSCMNQRIIKGDVEFQYQQ